MSSSSPEGFTVATSGTTVYGGPSRDVIAIRSGVTNVTLDQNIEKIKLPGTADNFTFRQMGNILAIYDVTGVTPIVIMPVQGDEDGTQIGFTNQTCDARLVTGSITIGGATVPSDSPQAIWPLTQTSTVEPPISGVSTAGIFMGNNDFFIVDGNGSRVYGKNGLGTVTMGYYALGVTLDQNVAQINFANPADSYKFKQTGNIINVYNTADQLIVKAPVQGDADGTILSFGSQGTASAKLTGGVMMLGEVVVSPVIATTLSPTLR